MKVLAKLMGMISCATLVVSGLVACGSSGGGDSGSSMTIEGTLRAESSSSRVLGPNDGGIAGVTVSALGDSTLTDESGNFRLSVDGETFQGGEVLFIFNGSGIDTSVVMDNVLGGIDVVAFTDFVREGSGNISGESFDAAGNLIGTTPGGRLNCSVTKTFVDGGGGGSLWKPFSERTGTPVALMPSQYRDADVAIFNNRGEQVDGPVLRNCCNNGGREHVYFSRNAQSLATVGLPLTVRFAFADGFVDCRTVDDPSQRYD